MKRINIVIALLCCLFFGRPAIGMNPLNELKTAIEQENSKKAKEILTNNPDIDVNAFFPNGNTLLIQATANNDFDNVELLLQSEKIQINKKSSKFPETALHVAARKENDEIVTILLSHGADSTLKDSDNKTPYELVSGMSSTGQILKNAAINLEKLEALIRNAYKGKTNDLHFDNNIKINNFIPSGNIDAALHLKAINALIASILSGSLGTVKKLLVLYPPGTPNGIDLNAITIKNKNLTPLMVANDAAIAKFLVQQENININAKSNLAEKPTALHQAAAGDDSERVKILLNAGADLTIKNDFNKNALDLAPKGSNTEKILKKSALKNLIDAAYYGDEKKVKEYLHIVDDPNEYLAPKDHELTESEPLNALAAAIVTKHQSIVGLLLQQKNIDPKIVAPGTTLSAMDYAISENITNVIVPLLNKMNAGNGDIDVADEGGETPIYKAIKYGNLPLFKYFKSKGAKLAAKTPKGQTLLEYAKTLDNKEIINILTAALKPPKKPKPPKKTPQEIEKENLIKLTKAALDGKTKKNDLVLPGVDPAIINKILPLNDVTGADDKSPTNPLVAAITNGHTNTVKALLKFYPDIDLTLYVDDYTPLMRAVNANSLDIVNLLLKQNVPITATSHTAYKATALHYAVAKQNADIIQALIKKSKNLKSDLEAKTANGLTPLQIAISKKNKEIVDILEQAAKNLAPQEKPEITHLKNLIHAIHNGQSLEQIKEELSKVDNPNIYLTKAQHGIDSAKFELNPLSEAIIAQRDDVVKELLKHPKIDLYFQEEQQHKFTPLHYAADAPNLNAAKLLLEENADVNIKNSDGNTPLHVAIEKNTPAVVSLLVQYGADPTIANNAGKTPLKMAQKNKKLLKLLQNKPEKPVTNVDIVNELATLAEKLGNLEESLDK